jgi:hypothetical protein
VFIMALANDLEAGISNAAAFPHVPAHSHATNDSRTDRSPIAQLPNMDTQSSQVRQRQPQLQASGNVDNRGENPVTIEEGLTPTRQGKPTSVFIVVLQSPTNHYRVLKDHTRPKLWEIFPFKQLSSYGKRVLPSRSLTGEELKAYNKKHGFDKIQYEKEVNEKGK